MDVIGSCIPVSQNLKWLDFGAGNGGLVRHVRSEVGCPAWGYEQGWIKERAEKQGVPFLNDDELKSHANSFDVVTALEVLEHVVDPLAELAKIRSLLRPRGLFFYTTGNAERHRRRFVDWSYVNPEVHISFFEPRTMESALRKTGFGLNLGTTRRDTTRSSDLRSSNNLGKQAVSSRRTCALEPCKQPGG